MSTIKSTSFPASFNFIGNPIVVEVTNTTNVEGSSMHQTVIEVMDKDTHTVLYTFECESAPGHNVSVDISSALRAVVIPNTNPSIWNDNAVISYPKKEFYVRAYDRYMRDGSIFEGLPSCWPKDADKDTALGGQAFLGGLSEMERFVFSNHPSDFCKYLSFSRKPKSGERWGMGDFKLTSRFKTTERSVTADGVKTKLEVGEVETGVHRIQAEEVTLPANHRHFLFINSMGVYETVSAVMRESLSYGMESNVHILAGRPSYKGVASLSLHKTAPRSDFRMSSGYVSREWADWWTTEFLSVKYCWIKMDVDSEYTQEIDEKGGVISVELMSKPHWIPCVIVPSDEDVLVYDRSEPQLPHVDFDVRLAVTGSVVSAPILAK